MKPLTWPTALASWQFAPLVSAVLAAAVLLYAAGVIRVRRRHPARPWPLSSSLSFAGGLAVVAIATQSSVGVYDDVLFSDHMVQHVLLIMAAPPLLVLGRPVTLVLHAWGNPVHTLVRRAIRSRPVLLVTHPVAAVLLYCAVVAGTHTPPFMDLVLQNEAIHDAEHAIYLLTGYIFFLVVIGSEPVRHRVSVIGAFLMLLITMLVDSGTGVVCTLQSHEVFSPYAQVTRRWGPRPVTDLHLGGYIMLIGSDVIMTIVAVALASRFLRAETLAVADPDLSAYNRYLQSLAFRQAGEEAVTRRTGPGRG